MICCFLYGLYDIISGYFRLLLVQEKEQLLRELRGIDLKGRSSDDIENINDRIRQLGVDLNHAKEISNKQIAER